MSDCAFKKRGWRSALLPTGAALLLLLNLSYARAADGPEVKPPPVEKPQGLNESAGLSLRPPCDPGRAEFGLDEGAPALRTKIGVEAVLEFLTDLHEDGTMGAGVVAHRKNARVPKVRLPYDIPVVYNDMVEDWIGYFQGSGRKYYHKWLQRFTRFSPEIKNVLREYKLPEDTIFLAMIESGFSPYALSKSAAGGIWQFIPGTAKRYGLKIDFWRDERRDPVKSTRAAAMYLRDLYNYFGSWWLAWAGYNSGEGKIFRALKRYDTDDFWELSSTRFLRKETRNYVPKLIAAALIAKNPEAYGYGDVEYLVRLEYEEVEIPSPVDLRVIANTALSDLETIEVLNPELRRGCTPPNQPTYVIRIPKGSKERFLAVFNAVPPEQRFKVEQYVTKKGDTLAGIAKARGVKTSVLAEFNGLAPKASLKSGTELQIPSVYVRDEETEERWDKKFNRIKSKKTKGARKAVGSREASGRSGG